MLKFKNEGILIKRNSKIICSYHTLHARIFPVRHKALRTRCAHAYEHPRDFSGLATYLDDSILYFD